MSLVKCAPETLGEGMISYGNNISYPISQCAILLEIMRLFHALCVVNSIYFASFRVSLSRLEVNALVLLGSVQCNRNLHFGELNIEMHKAMFNTTLILVGTFYDQTNLRRSPKNHM